MAHSSGLTNQLVKLIDNLLYINVEFSLSSWPYNIQKHPLEVCTWMSIVIHLVYLPHPPFYWWYHMTCGILVPRDETHTLCSETLSPNHWTAKQFPHLTLVPYCFL